MTRLDKEKEAPEEESVREVPPSKPEIVEPDPEVKVEQPKEELKAPAPPKKKPKRSGPAKVPPSPVHDEMEPVSTRTYRLPISLIERLQMISLKRKVGKIRPNSQQDLLAQALTEWLDKNEI